MGPYFFLFPGLERITFISQKRSPRTSTLFRLMCLPTNYSISKVQKAFIIHGGKNYAILVTTISRSHILWRFRQ